MDEVDDKSGARKARGELDLTGYMGGEADKSEKRKKIKSVAVKFYVYAFGYLLLFSPFIAVVGLQSSVNIEDGLGTLSLGVAYLVSFAFAIFCTPTLIRRFGCKWTYLAGEATYLVYVASNYYPTSYTLFTAGVLLGIGDAVIWTALQMYNVHFGRLQAKVGSRGEEHYVRKYMGHFFAVFQLSQVLGNGISYAVLYAGKNKDLTTTSPTNVTGVVAYRYQHCGANDCQDANVTDANLDQYVPTSRISFYILVTVYCAMCIAGLVIHVRFLPKIRMRSGEEIESIGAQNLTHKDAVIHQQQTLDATARATSVRKTLAATLRQLILPKQLLITPLSLYFGCTIVLSIVEVTRAYSSCIVGVEKVGLGLMTFASASALTSAFMRRMLLILGPSGLVVATFVVDTSTYLFCLLWRPAEDNTYLVYVIFVASGISNGAWQNNILGMYNRYFPENPEISFTVWNALVTMGISVANTCSSLLCVSTKLYFLLGFLAFSVASYGVVEYTDRAKQKR